MPRNYAAYILVSGNKVFVRDCLVNTVLNMQVRSPSGHGSVSVFVSIYISS